MAKRDKNWSIEKYKKSLKKESKDLILKKGQWIVRPPNKFRPDDTYIFYKIVRVYFSGGNRWFDGEYDFIHEDGHVTKEIMSWSELMLSRDIEWEKFSIIDNEKQLLKFKLTSCK